jgi:cytosine/adenosine deaminase-related metal-dependent hydrolase
MRKITADYILPISSKPIENGVVVIDDDGTILRVGKQKDYDKAELEEHKGVICPGFVNAHCHLELSFMKGAIREHTGLPEFVKQVVDIRDKFREEEQRAAITAAEDEMIANGIVAVGDISNDARSFFQKEKGRLRYHTFVEVFDLGPSTTQQSIDNGRDVFRKVPDVNNSTASVTFHAPYSCTLELIKWTDKFSAENGHILSIHMQEQREENQLFIEKEGAWVELYRDFGLDLSWFAPTGKSSLQSVVQHLIRGNTLAFVHNTFTTKADVKWAQNFSDKVFWCFCPSANLYIENTLPDYNMFLDARAKCVIGTDSLASNSTLSVLEEMKTIAKKAPEIPPMKLFEWATINGAQMLRYDQDLGSIEPGKRPGLNLITGMDTKEMRLLGKSKAEKLA